MIRGPEDLEFVWLNWGLLFQGERTFKNTNGHWISTSRSYRRWSDVIFFRRMSAGKLSSQFFWVDGRPSGNWSDVRFPWSVRRLSQLSDTSQKTSCWSYQWFGTKKFYSDRAHLLIQYDFCLSENQSSSPEIMMMWCIRHSCPLKHALELWERAS